MSHSTVTVLYCDVFSAVCRYVICAGAFIFLLSLFSSVRVSACSFLVAFEHNPVICNGVGRKMARTEAL